MTAWGGVRVNSPGCTLKFEVWTQGTFFRCLPWSLGVWDSEIHWGTDQASADRVLVGGGGP